MNVRTLLALGSAAALLASGCAPHPASRAGSPPASGWRQLEIGLCEDYPEESRSLAAAARDLEWLRTNNFRTLRIAFGWDAIEPEPGKYDWSFWDDFVRLAQEQRIRLIPYVCYTPRWASRSAGDDFWRQPPRDHARFAEFMKQIVARYRDQIHSWELWNEPDNPAYWLGSPEEYARLLEAGSRAAREADPHATIVLGGLAWNLEFLETLLADGRAMSNVDVVNLHNYYETWSSDPLERLPEYIGRADDLIHQHGGRQPIWTAEIGYSTHREGPIVSGQYRAYFAGEHSAAQQASSLFRALTLLAATEKVRLAAWYRLHDLPAKQEVIGDVNNRHLGVVDERGNAKPALAALKFFHALFADGFECLDARARVQKEIGSPAEAHVFKTSDGRVVVIAWLRTHVAGTRGDVLSGEVPDTRESVIRLTLPFAVSNGAVFDERGRRQRRISAAHTHDGWQVDELHLRGGSATVLIFESAR